MQRDVSAITATNCIAVVDDKTIISFTDLNTQTYKLLSNKYILIENNEVSTPADNLVCYTTSQIQNIPSPYDFMTPVYESTAILSAVLIFYFAYKLILYPFFRTRT